ncbi:11650_t:CDS:1, partial [Gigaspora rosea]
MSVKRANSIYLINLILIFCLINLINSGESAIGQMLYADFTALSVPIFVINQTSDGYVSFGGQLKHKFHDTEPGNYIFRLMNGGNDTTNILAIYNFANLNITINPPNTESFYVTVQGKFGYDLKAGRAFQALHLDRKTNEVSYLAA